MTFLEKIIFKFTVYILETSYCSLLHHYKREIVTKVEEKQKRKRHGRKVIQIGPLVGKTFFLYLIFTLGW